jgi:hypothetical protein
LLDTNNDGSINMQELRDALAFNLEAVVSEVYMYVYNAYMYMYINAYERRYVHICNIYMHK